MKKFISILAAAAISLSCANIALAADKEKGEPDVYVDGSKIVFPDQNALIVDSRTLVPARGVFSAMGCKVDWDGEARTVRVTGPTGVRYVIITIDSDIMDIYTYKTVMNLDKTEYKLDVPAQIMNDRTMIPLRAVSEAFECLVEWDQDNYRVDITSGDPILTEDAKPAATATPKPATSGGGSGSGSKVDSAKTDAADDEADGEAEAAETGDAADDADATDVAEDTRTSMSLSTDKTGELAAGEEFTVYIDADKFPEGAEYVNGVVATFEYDKSKFEYVEGSGTMLGDADVPYTASEFVENTEYDTGTRLFFITISEEGARTMPGHVFKATFKSLTGESGSITLNNDFAPLTLYNSYLQFYNGSKKDPDVMVMGRDLDLSNGVITIG